LNLERREYRAINRALERAEEVDDRICHCLDILAIVEARIQEGEPGEPTGHDKRGRKELQQRLVKLEAKKRELEKKCFKSFVGYPVVPDLIDVRDMDVPHEWKSISQLRQYLSRPRQSRMDKWQQQVLASYSNEQIEQELLAFCQYKIEGTRQHEGVTEYLLP